MYKQWQVVTQLTTTAMQLQLYERQRRNKWKKT